MTNSASDPIRVTVVRNSADAPLGAWADLLGDDPRVVRADEGEPVPSEIGDALVVLGGPASAHDDATAPWFPAVRDLLRDAVARDVPVLAVGLGAQLLALATGGRVEADAPPGPEIGPTVVFWRAAAATDPVLGPLVAAAEHGRGVLMSDHRDAIVELPDAAVWLASSRTYPFQAFRIGSALGVQFHPEATRALVERWTAAAGTDAAAILSAYDDGAAAIETVGRLLAESFVAAIR